MRLTTRDRILRAFRRAGTFAGVREPDDAVLLTAGQTLVLNYARTITADEADRIRARVRADFPGLPVLLVCADDLNVRQNE